MKKALRSLSFTEAFGASLLLALAVGGILCLAFQLWIVAGLLLFASVACVGAFALFSARRSRVVAQRITAGINEQTQFLFRQIRPNQGFGGGGQAFIADLDSDQPSVAAGQRLAMPVADVGVLSTYMSIADAMPDHNWLDNTILRNASVSARDLLAWRASGGRLSYNQLARWLVLARHRATRQDAYALLANTNVEWSLRLARIVALQDIEADDRLNALTLYRSLYTIHGPQSIKPRHSHARVFYGVAFHLGEFELADEIIRRVRCAGSDLPYMRTDLVNPFSGSPFGDAERWLEIFNQHFVADGLEPVALAEYPDEDRVPFDRLVCKPGTFTDEGPLVSVVVSSWKPGLGLETAVRSLLAQSYRNLEILLVDDASPQEFQPLLDRMAALDSRIRVIKQPVNGGTYVARNSVLDMARGEFLTFLDSDDWSHPRRIELQAKALMEDEKLVCTHSRALRTNPDLIFNLPGVLARRENASSLMFRRKLALDRVGYFDHVRKGADTEYALRLRQVFGPDSHRLIDMNLAMIRLTTGSLSREEFKPGWRHPSRAAYRRSYEHWHRTFADNAHELRTSRIQESRPFQAPVRFLVSRDGDEAMRRANFDIVFAADLRHGTESVRALLDEVRACRRAGMTVGVIQIESFARYARVDIQPFWRPVREAIANGEVDEVLLTDTSSVTTVVVRDPIILQFVSTEPSALSVGRIIVTAENAPKDMDGRVWYEPSVCHRNAQALFGARPLWSARSEGLANILRELLPRNVVLPGPLPMVTEVSSAATIAQPLDAGKIIIGRVAEEHLAGGDALRSELLACYPDTSGFEVRMLGGRSQCETILGTNIVPENWSFHDIDEIPLEVFLASCTFIVYFDASKNSPSGLRVAIEAMASGCIVVLPPDYASIYGDAAVYCACTEVVATLKHLVNNPEQMRRQRENAIAFVRNQADGARFVEALKAMA
jgi:glycosyltransferase involved in cell wall biosynthesis